MAVKREVPNADDLIRRYVAGEAVMKLLKEFAVSGCLFSRLLRDAGVKRRTFKESRTLMKGRPCEARRWAPDNPAALVAEYLAGASEKTLADRCGVSRDAFRSMLLRHGVEPRGRSAAELLKWSELKADREAVERQCGAAWAAARARDNALEAEVKTLYGIAGMSALEVAGVTGATKTNVKRLIRRLGISGQSPERTARGFAATNREPACRSVYEPPVLLALRAVGLHAVHQQAIGACNVDIALPECRIAVEVERRYVSDSHSLRAERLKHLLDRGWRLIVVYSPRKLPIDAAAVAKQIFAISELASRHPATAGQYWVVGRDGQDFPRRRPDLDGWTRVACPHADIEVAEHACAG